jgi:hypothetical protein
MLVSAKHSLRNNPRTPLIMLVYKYLHKIPQLNAVIKSDELLVVVLNVDLVDTALFHMTSFIAEGE